jgi:glycerol-3-phosphate acyltransferase PlsX
MRIAVDAMGGDYAPEETVRGAVGFARGGEAQVLLCGPQHVLMEQLARNGVQDGLVEVVHAPEVVGMDEPPTTPIRRKPRSSVSVATDLVRDGAADAVVSVGNTGAFMAKAFMSLGTVPGVDRPAIAVTMPANTGLIVLVDAGANVDCREEMLVQFAVMGSIYASTLSGIESPKVALLNIGSEYVKGDRKSKRAHELLQAAPINFTGNVEGNTMFSGEADVIVCDGFVGNVALKVAEGTVRVLQTRLRRELMGSLRGRIGAWILREPFERLRTNLDYATYGGGLLAGLNGVCVAGHGRSRARAVSNALRLAQQAVQKNVIKRFRDCCTQLALANPKEREGGSTDQEG